MFKPLKKIAFSQNELLKITGLTYRQVVNLKEKNIIKANYLHFEYVELLKACIYAEISKLASCARATKFIKSYNIYTPSHPIGTILDDVLITRDIIIIDLSSANIAMIVMLDKNIELRQKLTTSFSSDVISFKSKNHLDIQLGECHFTSDNWMLINLYKLRKDILQKMDKLGISREKAVAIA